GAVQVSDHRHRRLLRARRERPRGGSAKRHYERAPVVHSITSSARASSIVAISPLGRETAWLGVLSMGKSILQDTPSDANARSTEPPNSRGRRPRMVRPPYPQSGEAATVGPPISRHTIDRFAASLWGPRCQFTSTRPCGVESAPYFAAFVTNSCSTIASVWVAGAVRVTGGPPIVPFTSDAVGSSSRWTSSARSTPSQWF